MKLSKIIPSVSLMALATLHVTAADAKAAPAAKVVLTVNDTNPIGTAGDSLLSLDEAIRLANGTLALDKLSAAERAQVKGAPGARSRDLITLPKGATMTVPEGAALSPLVGNDGDIIDGNDAVLVAGKDGKGKGFAVSSSNFTLRNLQAKGFATAVDVDFGGRVLSNISLEKLHLVGVSFMSALLSVGATTSNGSLHGITVADSVVETGKEVVQANLIFIRAAATPPTGTVDNVLLENVRFVRNRVDGGGLGIYLTGSLGGGHTTNAVTRNVVFTDNIFTGQHDAAINFVGGLPAAGGRHTKVGLENVVATGNRIEAPNWGFYMGNENFGAWNKMPSGSMTDSYLRNLTVAKNIVTRNAKGSVGHCISLENGADFRGDQATNNVIENFRIADNDISGCVETQRTGRSLQSLGAGVYVNAGRASLGSDNSGGTARNNMIRNIAITNNRIKDSTRGIVVNGGYNRYAGTAPDFSAVTGNSLTGLRIEANQLQNNETGIRVVAGDGAQGATVTGNSLTGVKIQRNSITGSKIPCETIANAGSATGNSLNATCPASGR